MVHKVCDRTRESPPRSRNTRPTCEVVAYGSTGPRTTPAQAYRAGVLHFLLPKAGSGHRHYPLPGRETAKRGRGRTGNHHLHSLVASVGLNVGNVPAEAQVSRPPRRQGRGGGGVVRGARESRVQGEGRQGRSILPVGSMRSPRNRRGRRGRTRPEMTSSEVTLGEERGDLESPLRLTPHGGFGEGRKETCRSL